MTTTESLWAKGSYKEIEAVLAEISANQQAFTDAERSWKRHIPFWRLRRQYRLLKANEPLWRSLGCEPDPFTFETATGIDWAILRKLIGAGP